MSNLPFLTVAFCGFIAIAWRANRRRGWPFIEIMAPIIGAQIIIYSVDSELVRWLVTALAIMLMIILALKAPREQPQLGERFSDDEQHPKRATPL